jgi:hypothetical protein
MAQKAHEYCVLQFSSGPGSDAFAFMRCTLHVLSAHRIPCMGETARSAAVMSDAAGRARLLRHQLCVISMSRGHEKLRKIELKILSTLPPRAQSCALQAAVKPNR